MTESATLQDKTTPLGGWQKALLVTVEKRDLVFIFKDLNQATGSRLAKVHLRRGLSKRPFFHDIDKDTQAFDIHRSIFPKSYTVVT